MSLFLPPTASNVAEWIRKASAAINGLAAASGKFGSLSAAPTNPVPGQVYFDTSTNKARAWDGTAWQDLW